MVVEYSMPEFSDNSTRTKFGRMPRVVKSEGLDAHGKVRHGVLENGEMFIRIDTEEMVDKETVKLAGIPLPDSGHARIGGESLNWDP